jgi:hypothetical protein
MNLPHYSTDVYVKRNSHSRYIFAWNIGNAWMVATEQGSVALRAQCLLMPWRGRQHRRSD